MRLLRRLIDADPPKAVDIPTGLGKTSVMALWLLALAEGANLPRRLVYVVDRRAVVDQATRFAKRLRRNLLDELADRLRLREGTRSLPISTLRGGFADNRDWLEDPSKPAIVVGTIDMVGSRLLFEGYGISRGMRPYHASFLGVDSLVLLDEAHLCPPFEALLRQVAVHRDGKLGPSPDASTMTPPFRLMSLSATGREARELSVSVFKLEEQDREESVVLQRLTARKRLKVIELADQEKSLTDCIAKRAIELGGGDTPARVLVYCNSRKDAVDVKTLIDEKCKELNVGETRVIAELEGLDAVGLEAMGAPNPSHGGSADAGRGGHGAAAPVGGVGRFLAGGLVDDLLYFLLRDGRCTTGPWGVFCNAGDAAFEKARAPAGHPLPRDTELCGDLLILKTVGGQQDNPGSQGETNGDLAAARVAVQLLALRCVQSYWLCSSHPMPPVNRDDGKPI